VPQPYRRPFYECLYHSECFVTKNSLCRSLYLISITFGRSWRGCMKIIAHETKTRVATDCNWYPSAGQPFVRRFQVGYFKPKWYHIFVTITQRCFNAGDMRSIALEVHTMIIPRLFRNVRWCEHGLSNTIHYLCNIMPISVCWGTCEYSLKITYISPCRTG